MNVSVLGTVLHIVKLSFPSSLASRLAKFGKHIMLEPPLSFPSSVRVHDSHGTVMNFSCCCNLTLFSKPSEVLSILAGALRDSLVL